MKSHPEDFCEKCGRKNIVWFTDSELWNRVNGSPNGILCPICFVELADPSGAKVWKLTSSEPAKEIGILRAPWTQEQVENLKRRQKIGWMHEYTCGNGDENDRTVLVPTEAGWVCPACGYTQDWCHVRDANGEFATEWPPR